jgi:hypothetical protein
VYYEKKELEQIFRARFDVLAVETYKEMAKNDSIYVLARKRL